MRPIESTFSNAHEASISENSSDDPGKVKGLKLVQEVSSNVPQYHQGRNFFDSAQKLDKKRTNARPNFYKWSADKRMAYPSESDSDKENMTDNGQKATTIGEVDTLDLKNTLNDRRIQK